MLNMMCSPIFEREAKNFPSVAFAVVDVDVVGDVAKELKARCMPTYVFLMDGQEFSRIDGASEQMIISHTKNLILQKQPSYMENGVMHIVKERDFYDYVQSKPKVVVDFFADWCG